MVQPLERSERPSPLPAGFSAYKSRTHPLSSLSSLPLLRAHLQQGYWLVSRPLFAPPRIALTHRTVPSPPALLLVSPSRSTFIHLSIPFHEHDLRCASPPSSRPCSPPRASLPRSPCPSPSKHPLPHLSLTSHSPSPSPSLTCHFAAGPAKRRPTCSHGTTDGHTPPRRVVPPRSPAPARTPATPAPPSG